MSFRIRKAEGTVRNRTKKSRNNKSSCIAERQAVLVSWTHPEKKAVSRQISDALVTCCRLVHKTLYGSFFLRKLGQNDGTKHQNTAPNFAAA